MPAALASDAGFIQNMRWSLNACASNPTFVGVLVAYLALARWSDGVAPLSSVLWILLGLGFWGVERVFFYRALRKTAFSLGEVPGLMRHLIGRFFVVTLLAGSAALALLLVVAVITGISAPSGNGTSTLSVSFRVSALVIALLIDVVFTFVTPALVLATRSAREAISVGWRFLRSTWPSSNWYALAPGITVTLVALTIPPADLDLGLSVVVYVVAGLVALVCRGACVAFYVQRGGLTNVTPLDVAAETL